MSEITTDFNIEPEPDVIITKFMSELSTFLELEIKSKWETLELYKQILQTNPDDQLATQQVNTNIEELRGLIKSLLDVRKDSEFINPDTVNIIQSIESICPHCGEFKKKEQVTLVGPFDRPAIKKKKKKASHVRKKFEFTFKGNTKEWSTILKEELKTFDQASSFIGTVVYDDERQEMFITIGPTVYTFCNVPERKFDGFEGAGSKGAFFNREIKEQHNC